jgi:hypothetical protein
VGGTELKNMFVVINAYLEPSLNLGNFVGFTGFVMIRAQMCRDIRQQFVRPSIFTVLRP